MLRSTHDIEIDVRAALDSDSRITHPQLIAVTVDAIGTVTLRGAVYHPHQRHAAADAGRNVAGVSEVITDELKVHLPVGHHRADDAIRAVALQRLSDDSGIHAEHIHVKVSLGHLTLGGYVRTQSQRDAASEDVADVTGVTRVSNEIAVH